MRLQEPAAWIRATSMAMLLGVVAALAACAPPNGGIVPIGASSGQPATSAGTASAAPRPIEGYTDPKVVAMVREVSSRLLVAAGEAPDSWRVTVLDKPDVNAYALPSRDILLTRGLLALLEDKAQLAAVIGHEIGHVVARHAEQRRQTQTRNREAVLSVARSSGDPNLVAAVMLVGIARERAYSREHEFEADRIGIGTMADAGYDAAAAVAALERIRLADQLEALRASRSVDAVDGARGVLSTHPRTIDRVAAARDLVRSKGAGRTERDAYLAAIDGMLFGDTPNQGFVRGRRFEHPEIGLAFEVPPGYRLINTPRAVYAEGPDAAIMSFSCTRGQPRSVLDIARSSVGEAIEDRMLTVNGLPAATAASIRPSDRLTRRVLIVAFEPLTCGFAMFSPASAGIDRTQEMLTALQSFRRLSARERSALRPQRLRVVTVRAGDTVASLAGAGGGDDLAVEQFRTINGLAPDDTPTPGTRVKVVRAE